MFNGAVRRESLPYGAIVSRNVVALRARARLKQSEIAVRMRVLGFSWHPQTVGEVEKGNRRVAAEELLGLALALGTNISSLLLPAPDEGPVRLPSGHDLDRLDVADLVLASQRRPVIWDDERPVFIPRPLGAPVGANWLLPAIESHPDLFHAVEPESAAAAAEQPIVAAIVTSRRGVLITARKDGSPPWGFVTGEVEPGERPEDACWREVKEETGLEVRPGEMIGERDHPQTGRHMIYMAARPVSSRNLKVAVGDEAELAEVRWASLAEAEELLPSMFAPVREHLAVMVGGQQ